MNVEVDNENEIELIMEKLMMFKLFKPLFEKMELYANDEELISVFNYLFNSIFVFFNVDKKKRIMTYLNLLFCVVYHLNLKRPKHF